MSPEPARSSARDVWIGIGLFLLCGIAGLLLAAICGALRFLPPRWIEVPIAVSLMLVPPGLWITALITARRKGHAGIVKGLIIGLSIAVLLVAACFGIVLVALSRSSR